MSGLYIPGLSMPRKTGIVSIVLSGDGSALLCADGVYSEIKVIPVPDHGDLIDKGTLTHLMGMDEHFSPLEAIYLMGLISDAPTIIEAEEREG